MIFSLIKQVFILSLSSSESLACNRTKCLFLNDELCMVRPTPINMNPVELRCYPFMISLNKCSGSCNVLYLKISVPKETKDINVKAFNIIANINEAKAMTERLSCDCKCKFNITICNSNQECNNKTYQYECKNVCKCKNDCNWIMTCICENIKYLESIADASVTDCHKIKNVMDTIATKRTNTMAATMTNSIATNEDFDLDNIFKVKKSHENILIYDISYKTLINLKSLHIRFDKIDGFI